MVAMLQFKKRPHEVYDEAHARFENLKIRMGKHAPDFYIPWTLLPWLFLEAMYVPRHMWPLILQPTAGRLPVDEDGFVRLQSDLRHQGHMAEMGRQSLSAFPSHYIDEDTGAALYDDTYPQSFFQEGSHYNDDFVPGAGGRDAPTGYDDEGWGYCTHCDSYLEEFGNDNDTDTEDESEAVAWMSHGELLE